MSAISFYEALLVRKILRKAFNEDQPRDDKTGEWIASLLSGDKAKEDAATAARLIAAGGGKSPSGGGRSSSATTMAGLQREREYRMLGVKPPSSNTTPGGVRIK